MQAGKYTKRLIRTLGLFLITPLCSIVAQDQPLPYTKIQFFDNNGDPLAGGKVFTCVAGTTCPGTPLNSYTDFTGGTPNSNPVILDAGGRAAIYLGAAAYKVVLEDALGNVIWSQDGIQPGSIASLSFVQAGAGAVARNAQDKMREQFSVTDYGADKSGVTDATGAFALAIAYGSAARGGAEVFVPCGSYKLVGTPTINVPTVSLRGEVKTCVQLNYTGAGSGIIWQMNPFTITPAGTFSEFTLNGTSAAQNGILSGQIVGSQWRNLTILGFTHPTANGGLGGAAIHLHNAGNLATWTERNDFINVQVGSSIALDKYAKNGFLLTSDVPGNSFGYNRWLDIGMNPSTGEVGFNFQSGFLYNSTLTAICNADNVVTGTIGPICIRSNGNWDSNITTLNGEFQNPGSGTGTDYAVQVESGAKFNGWGHVNVFNPGGSLALVNNLSGVSSNIPNVNVSQGYLTAWDTGTFTLPTYGGVGTPQPGYRAIDGLGSVGVLYGSNFSSPYVSMFNEAHNAFVVGTINAGQTIGQMNPVLTVDAFGNTATVGHFWAGFPISALGTVDTTVLSDINGSMTVRGAQGHWLSGLNGALHVGGLTSSGKAGYSNVGLFSTTGYNESISFAGDSGAGYGIFSGVNLEHPAMWGLDTDSILWSLHKKTVGVAISDANRIAFIDQSGNYSQNGSRISIGNNNISWTTTNVAPVGACQTGSLHSNFAGGAGTTFYVCEAAVWVAK